MSVRAMKNLLENSFQNTLIIGLVAWAAFVSVTDYWPASRWLEVRSVQIDNAAEGEEVTMTVDRQIHSDFIGEWVVSVRNVDYGVVCTATGVSSYRKGAKFPNPLTLDWWTNGECSDLPAGKYFVATDWLIRAHGIWPEKTFRQDSNVFEISGK